MRILRVDVRTRLRPVELTDAGMLFTMVDANRAYLRKWMSWVDSTCSDEHTHAFIEKSLAERDSGVAFDFVIERETEPCGMTGLTRIDKQNRIGSLGYWLREDRQGLGIVTTSCRALIRLGFDQLNLNRITLAAAIDNHRSRAVAERLGFVLEGTLREAEWVNDHFVDHALYSLLKREWDDQDAR